MLTTQIKWLSDQEGAWLCCKAPLREVMHAAESFRDGKTYEVLLKEHRKRRSLDANAFFWKICDEIAEKLLTTKDEVYIHYIKMVGVFRDFHLSHEEAETFRTAWGMLGTGWKTEIVDYQSNGNDLVIRAYYGSSTYNTKQMSRIIEAAVEDAKALGIETLTPDEMLRMGLKGG